MSNIHIPFNYRPYATGVTGASYQPPAGFYSRVVISAMALSMGYNGTVTGGESNTQNLELWLNPGDIITITKVDAVGSSSSPTNGISSVNVFLNGSNILAVRAVGAVTAAGSFTGETACYINYAEYQAIT